MKDLGRSDTASILKRHGIRPRHRLGQNFLQDPSALQQIVDISGIQPEDVILEIGCGLGNLTSRLSQAARSVVAIEVDPRLVAVAQEELGAVQNVRIVCADFLKLKPGDLDVPSGYVVVANIPYYITSPILRHLLESEPKPRRIILTVQKEVAARITAKPPDMSLLAVSVQIYGSARVAAHIPSHAFYPAPKVDSAVVRIDCYEQPVVPPGLRSTFFDTVRAGFGQRRKMLSNTLAGGLGFSTAEARILLRAADIDPRRRAETLGLEDWLQLARLVSDWRS